MKVDRIYLVGAGGTGSILAEPLARLAAWHPHAERATLVVADGDRYEPENGSRQLVPWGEMSVNKASATASRIANALGNDTRYASWPEYADYGTLYGWLARTGHNLLVLAVDNAATHKAALDASDAARRHRPGACDLTIVRPGNGAGGRWGLVTCSTYAVREGRPITADPRDTNPEIREPADRVPGGGCAAVAPSEPQRIAANALAAALALAVVAAVLDDRPWPGLLHGELGDGSERPGDAWRVGPASETCGGAP